MRPLSTRQLTDKQREALQTFEDYPYDTGSSERAIALLAERYGVKARDVLKVRIKVRIRNWIHRP